MSHTLTETATNADFTTGKTVPDVGDSGTLWWGLLIAEVQQSSDREQWLKAWLTDTPKVRVVMSPLINTSSRFTATAFTNGGLYWNQSSVADAGGLYFPVGNLPVGRKITQVIAYWANPTNGSAASAIGTPPALKLIRRPVTTGTVDGFSDPSVVVTTATDTTAVVGDYQTVHPIASSTISLTIADDQEYVLKFTGEAGANSATGGHLCGLRVVLGY